MHSTNLDPDRRDERLTKGAERVHEILSGRAVHYEQPPSILPIQTVKPTTLPDSIDPVVDSELELLEAELLTVMPDKDLKDFYLRYAAACMEKKGFNPWLEKMNHMMSQRTSSKSLFIELLDKVFDSNNSNQPTPATDSV
jgi:hypothetical protein